MSFAADFGSVTAFGFEDFWVSGVGVAPAQILADRTPKSWMIGVVAVRDHELAERPEVRFDRIGR